MHPPVTLSLPNSVAPCPSLNFLLHASAEVSDFIANPSARDTDFKQKSRARWVIKPLLLDPHSNPLHDYISSLCASRFALVPRRCCRLHVSDVQLVDCLYSANSVPDIAKRKSREVDPRHCIASAYSDTSSLSQISSIKSSQCSAYALSWSQHTLHQHRAGKRQRIGSEQFTRARSWATVA